ncbi:hypothetical protein [Pseudomonas quasicaspiana]|uniref:hypothetical protein n=1 Tax=Pseudomonas quasicaspiana TaxID=2829821 RepID=UPI001E49E152|nr:hypothetical protein [Pseudomonas quasicaspiana]MCD5970723.1 hypothetical protein [Pseudomonas quasicaspiana]
MDRVVLAGCFLLVAFGVFLGVCIGASATTVSGIRAAMELLSFAGTAVTGVVAVLALTSWRNQFHHAKRFESLNDLKNSAIRLNSFIEYIDAVVKKMHAIHFNNDSSPSFRDEEDRAKRKWLDAIDDYGRAWGTASIFLTDTELAGLSAPVNVFVERSMEYPIKVMLAFPNAPTDDRFIVFLETAEEVMASACELCERARTDVEAILKRI